MLRKLLTLSALSAVALGAFARIQEGALLPIEEEDRRRSGDFEDASRDIVIGLAARAGFALRRCARHIPTSVWGNRMAKMLSNRISHMWLGFFANFESTDRRRSGFNVAYWLENVAGELDTDCSEGEEAFVAACTNQAQDVMLANEESSKTNFIRKFKFFAGGVDALMDCTLGVMEEVCLGWYTALDNAGMCEA